MTGKQKVIAEKLSEEAEASKVETYEELQEEFVNDEISEEEFERGLDNLFDSGDEFLERYNEQQQSSDPNIIHRFFQSFLDVFTSMSDEIIFRAREVGQVVAVFGTIGLTVYLISATNGFIIPLLIPISLILIFKFVGLID